MAVLIEVISVVIRADRLLDVYPGGWDAFKNDVPNATMCADNELVRVGFMTPQDVEGYIEKLYGLGLTYLENGTAQDMVVIDQMRGPAVPCTWAEFGHINLDNDPKKRVAVCRLKGSSQMVLARPDGWEYEQSLSASYGYVPIEHVEKSLTFLRHEEGLDVYRNDMTGEEVYIARSDSKKGQS